MERHNQTTPMKTQSTYSLLVKSQETGRSIFEGAVYAMVVLSTVVSILQFASQSVTVPVRFAATSAASTLTAEATTTEITARS